MKIRVSAAAAALLRELLGRAGADRNRILLTGVQSVDWQSLTFTGERHRISLRIPGPGAEELACRMTAGLEDAEFHIRGHVVADILLAGSPECDGDGSVSVELEALTIAE